MTRDPFEEIPPADAYIDATFGAGGYLAQRFDGYQPRPGQVALARAVDRAISERTHLLAEGPTGTGKSVGYAVPATYHAAATQKKVVIVTANIALQEQLVQKDLPLLTEILPWRFTYALAKGMNNYLCLDRYYETQAGKQTNLFGRGQVGGETMEERRQLDVIQEWAEASIGTGVVGATGDVSELPFEPAPNVWSRYSTSSDECKKQKCPSARDCFARAARKRFREATVIVTNYHLFFAHLAVWYESGQDLILPGFDFAVLDEAHKAADIARDFFGFKIGIGSVKRLGRRLRNSPDTSGIADALTRAAADFFQRLAWIRQDKNLYHVRLREPQASLPEWQRLQASLVATAEALEARHYRTSDAGEAQQLANDFARAHRVLASLEDAMTLADGANTVYFLDENDRKEVSIAAKKVDIGPILRRALFEKTKEDKEQQRSDGWDSDDDFAEDVADVPPDGNAEDDPFAGTDRAPQGGDKLTVVCTSATLAADEKFDYAAKELGCPPGYIELIAESPFRWREQALFIVPESKIVDPSDYENFPKAAAEVFAEIIEIANGRTLGLFTSWRSLNETYNRISRSRFRVLRQGDMPRTKLIEAFKSDTHSVLLGVESFWAGVDVPGESLSCVVMDKLPFPHIEDPVLDVIQQRDKNWFFTYSVPRAIIQIKQGFGRLIRAAGDHGAVVCLDKRLLTKKYGKSFLRSLPPVGKSTDLAALGPWLGTELAEEPDPFDGIEEDADSIPF